MEVRLRDEADQVQKLGQKIQELEAQLQEARLRGSDTREFVSPALAAASTPRDLGDVLLLDLEERKVFIQHDFRGAGSLGMRLRQEGPEDSSDAIGVKSLDESHPELRGKIHPGMVLCNVGDVDVNGMEMDAAVEHIQKAGRPVTLTLCLLDVLKTCAEDAGKLQIQAVVDALTEEVRQLRKECEGFRLLAEANKSVAEGQVSRQELEVPPAPDTAHLTRPLVGGCCIPASDRGEGVGGNHGADGEGSRTTVGSSTRTSRRAHSGSGERDR